MYINKHPEVSGCLLMTKDVKVFINYLFFLTDVDDMIELSPFFVCYPLSESVLKNKINRARDRHYILHFKIEFIARNLLLCAENQISGSPHRAASTWVTLSVGGSNDLLRASAGFRGPGMYMRSTCTPWSR
jgi:hypothetical protein